VKKSPAEEALRRHLAELEAAKLDKKTKPKETAKAQDSSKVKKK
jgi:hypothetical protein